MSVLKIFAPLAMVLLLFGCSSSGDESDQTIDAQAPIEETAPSAIPTPSSDATANQANTPPPESTLEIQPNTNQGDGQQVFHYTCANGCAGGSDQAIACPNCGTTLAHNQAFHANDQNATPPPPNPNTPPPTPNPAEASGQNANGVWHYTCANGCAGGSATASACSSCGSTLAHNQGFHN